jgi:hypothetical protein
MAIIKVEMHGRIPGGEDDTAGAMTLRRAVTGQAKGVRLGSVAVFYMHARPVHSTFGALWGRGKHVMCVHESGAFRNQDPMNKGKRSG